MGFAKNIDYLQGALANGVISPQDALSQLMALQEQQKAVKAPAGIASGLREAAYAGAKSGTPLEQLLMDPSVAGAVQARPNKAMGILSSLYHTDPVPGGIPMAPDPLYGQSRIGAPSLRPDDIADIQRLIMEGSTPDDVLTGLASIYTDPSAYNQMLPEINAAIDDALRRKKAWAP